MMPAFHRERMDAAVGVMVDEAQRALEPWRPRRDGRRLPLDARPLDEHRDAGAGGPRPAARGDRARGRHGLRARARVLRHRDLVDAPARARTRRGRGCSGRDATSTGSSTARSPAGAREGADGDDVLSMLIQARDEDGDGFTDRELRDQTMHLLFGGHDTSSSTLSFLVYELARHPEVAARIRDEQDRVLDGRPPTVDELMKELPQLDMALDETLRLYPPVWFGPRKAVKDFEFQGHHIPAGTHIMHSSWTSHRLPHVFPRARGVHPRALHAGGPRQAAEGRLHPVRRRPADLHRQALRPAGREGGRDLAAPALRVRARARLRARGRQAADVEPPRRPAGGTRANPVGSGREAEQPTGYWILRPEIARAMTRRWISAVPSKMS